MYFDRDLNHNFNNEFSSNSNFDLNTRLQYLSKSTPQCLAILSQLWLWLLIECQPRLCLEIPTRAANPSKKTKWGRPVQTNSMQMQEQFNEKASAREIQ